MAMALPTPAASPYYMCPHAHPPPAQAAAFAPPITGFPPHAAVLVAPMPHSAVPVPWGGQPTPTYYAFVPAPHACHPCHPSVMPMPVPIPVPVSMQITPVPTACDRGSAVAVADVAGAAAGSAASALDAPQCQHLQLPSWRSGAALHGHASSEHTQTDSTLSMTTRTMSCGGTAPWEPEVGVVDLRLLLLKSRDMRRKLRGSQRHASRPQRRRNHNEAVKARRREEFAAQLAAMDAAARACGMLPPTTAEILGQAAMFAVHGFPCLPRRRQTPFVNGNVEHNDDNDIDDDEASDELKNGAVDHREFEAENQQQQKQWDDDAWSVPEMRPLFLARPPTASSVASADAPISPTTSLDGFGRSVSADGADAYAVFSVERNLAVALQQMEAGDSSVLSGPAATRGAIHAALYRKFVLSAAHHTNNM